MVHNPLVANSLREEHFSLFDPPVSVSPSTRSSANKVINIPPIRGEDLPVILSVAKMRAGEIRGGRSSLAIRCNLHDLRRKRMLRDYVTQASD